VTLLSVARMNGTFPKAIQAKGQTEVQLRVASINLDRLMKFRVTEVGTSALTSSC
jgi:hypothetical protein